MSRGSVTLSEVERAELARVVGMRGARSIREAAGLRTEQSIFRALSNAPVLPLTRTALLRACEQLTGAEGGKDGAGGSAP